MNRSLLSYMALLATAQLSSATQNSLYFQGLTPTRYSKIEDFPFPSTFTMEMWINPAETVTTGANVWFFSFASTSDNNCFSMVNSGFSSVGYGSWYYLVVTYDGTTTNAYVDGVLTNDLIFNEFCGATDAGVIVFGQEQDSLGGGFQGPQAGQFYLDTVAIYDEAWDAATISSNVAADKKCVDMTDSSLFAAWIGDSDVDQTINGYNAEITAESSTNSYTSGKCVTPTPSPTQVPTPLPTPHPSQQPTPSPTTPEPSSVPIPFPTSFPTALPTMKPSHAPTPAPTLVPTNARYSLYFQGASTSRYSIIDSFPFPTTFTMEMWINPVSSAGWFFSFGVASDVNCFSMVNSGFSTLGYGSWYYLVVTYDGTTTNAYVDGVLTNDLIFDEFCGATDAGVIVFGQEQDTLGGGFVGPQAGAFYLDTVAIYDEAWDAATISSNVAADKNCVDMTEPSLYAAWIGDNSVDQTYNGYDADITAISANGYLPGKCVTPTPSPTQVPTPVPSPVPSPVPTISFLPSPKPTLLPTPLPTSLPTLLPSPTPTLSPTPVPTLVPIPNPTSVPVPNPTLVPIPQPSPAPTPVPNPSPTQLPTLVPIPSPTSVPLPSPTPSPTFLPSSAPTTLPSSLPTARPTIVPSPSPTDSQSPSSLPTLPPSPSPTLPPSPVPTFLPTDSPTPAPIPAPTFFPVPSPTARPTHTVAPTTGDTISVDIGFSIVASAPPTNDDKISLKSTTATQIGVSEDSIKSFIVTSSASRRKLYEDSSPRVSVPSSRRLTSYAWDVSFTVKVSLSTAGVTSGSSLANSITNTLESDDYQTALTASIPSAVVDTSSIQTSLSSPTDSPTMPPSVTPTLPIPSDDDEGGLFNLLGASISVTYVIIFAAGLLSMVACGAFYVYKSEKQGDMMEVIEQEQEDNWFTAARGSEGVEMAPVKRPKTLVNKTRNDEKMFTTRDEARSETDLERMASGMALDEEVGDSSLNASAEDMEREHEQWSQHKNQMAAKASKVIYDRKLTKAYQIVDSDNVGTNQKLEALSDLGLSDEDYAKFRKELSEKERRKVKSSPNQSNGKKMPPPVRAAPRGPPPSTSRRRNSSGGSSAGSASPRSPPASSVGHEDYFNQFSLDQGGGNQPNTLI